MKKSKQVSPLRLDFGSGPHPREGFLGVDILDFGQKYVLDIRQKWPWKDSSVEEAHCSHFLEHLTAQERVHFMNELHRVLVPGGKCQIITPHWASGRAYGDPTHQWPPVAEMAFYYISREWRLGDSSKTPPVPANAPHTDVKFNPEGFSCDFAATWGYSLHPEVATRNQEYQQYAVTFLKEAASDIIATLVKTA